MSAGPYAKKSGVLGVLDRRAAHAASAGLDLMALELRNAEAAVAELIEASRESLRLLGMDRPVDPSYLLRDALARIGGDV